MLEVWGRDTMAGIPRVAHPCLPPNRPSALRYKTLMSSPTWFVSPHICWDAQREAGRRHGLVHLERRPLIHDGTKLPRVAQHRPVLAETVHYYQLVRVHLNTCPHACLCTVSVHIYRTGSIFGGTFRLGIIKRFVIRASLLRGNVQHERKTGKSFVVPRKRLTRITKSLSLPSQKVPARLEPFP